MVAVREKSELSGLQSLEIALSQMGALAESQLSDAITAFEKRDVALATKVIAADARIDDAHHAIEQNSVALLSKGNLSDEELREVVAAFKISGELERVGDLAKNVAKRSMVVSQSAGGMGIVGSIAGMGRQCLRQFSDVLDAFAEKNVKVAEAVWGADDNIDELYNSLFEETLMSMMRDSEQVSVCTHLVFVSKNFERVGDHATNIAEVLHFLVTGRHLTSDRPKGDETPTTIVALDDSQGE
ncbi:MAG: phosphate signaling complex protein PhoU [Pseudomonadota bacterium]